MPRGILLHRFDKSKSPRLDKGKSCTYALPWVKKEGDSKPSEFNRVLREAIQRGNMNSKEKIIESPDDTTLESLITLLIKLKTLNLNAVPKLLPFSESPTLPWI